MSDWEVSCWFKKYVGLAFQIERVFQATAGAWFVDAYYGPPEWKADAEGKPAATAVSLVEAAQNLASGLAGQGLDPVREAYLDKQVLAMETVCRKLAGERLPVEEEARRCLDVEIDWIPESHFEAVRDVWGTALSGTGALGDRYADWMSRNRLDESQIAALPVVLGAALAEARRRTNERFGPLPAGERVDLEIVRGELWGAANWYLGDGRSRMMVNVDQLSQLFGALYLVCHEAYPGHHTESAMKEYSLVRERGYWEQSLFLTISPQCAIAEGIASLSLDTIFSAEEAAAWAAEHLYAPLGIDVSDVDLAALFRSQFVRAIDDIGANVVLLLRDGCSQDEALAYLKKYLWQDEDGLRRYVAYLSNPLMEMYAFTYYFGRQAMLPLLQAQDRHSVFRRLLSEPLVPSLLGGWPGEGADRTSSQ